jgi:hypothetical protein
VTLTAQRWSRLEHEVIAGPDDAGVLVASARTPDVAKHIVAAHRVYEEIAHLARIPCIFPALCVRDRVSDDNVCRPCWARRVIGRAS